MVVSIYAGDLMTGEITIKVPTNSLTWSAAHRAEGSVGATVNLVGEVLDRFPDIVYQLSPWRCFLAAITDSGQVLQAGPILPHKYSDTTGILTLSALGLRGYFARRFLMPVLPGSANPADAEMTWSGMSLGTIAKRIVQLSMSHTGGALPIDLPADAEGINTRTYYGFELARISERLKQIEDVENGPDIAFQPYVVGDLDRVRWQMRVGTTEDPLLHQAGPDHVWDRTAPSTSIVSLDVDVDSSEMGDRAWVTGQGSDTELLMSTYQDQSLRISGYPLLEVDDVRSSVSELTTLDSYARALLRSSGRPWQTWTMVVRAERAPVLGTYRVGDWVRVHVGNNHPYIPARDGYYRTRIIDISGTDGLNVTLRLAPVMEDR